MVKGIWGGREEERCHDAVGDDQTETCRRENQGTIKNSVKCPLATPLIGSGIAGRGLELPRLELESPRCINCVCVCFIPGSKELLGFWLEECDLQGSKAE